MSKKVKYLPHVGLVRIDENKILPDCNEKTSCSVCEKAAECKQEKIESDANEIRTKYPDIAKMTVADIVATEMFAEKLKEAITSYRIVNYYAFVSLRKNKTLEPDNFRKEYIACMDKESSMPVAKRIIVLTIGNDAYRRTVTQMMNDYDEAKDYERVSESLCRAAEESEEEEL